MTELTCFAPHVRNHVEVVLTKQFVGLSRQPVAIKNPQPSCFSFEKNGNCDRFTIAIPFGGSCVDFTVMFQAADPHCPPDFVFIDETFFVPIEEIESLQTWDVHKSDGLWNVLKEIMSIYKKRNIEELEKYTELNYEYLSLFQMKKFSDEDIEVNVPYKIKSPVTMLIRMHVEFCDTLPDLLHKYGYDYALLLLIFPDRDTEKVSQRLYLSEDVKAAIGMNKKLDFSNFMREFQINRYILAIEDKLRCQVDLLISRHDKRKSFFSKFLSYCKRCAVEYDMQYFYSMAFLFEVERFVFLVEINLPENFPLGIPALAFRSIYHINGQRETFAVIDSYPFNSTWSLDKMVRESVKFIQAYGILLKEDNENGF